MYRFIYINYFNHLNLLQFYTEDDNATVLFYAKLQNDMAASINVLDNEDMGDLLYDGFPIDCCIVTPTRVYWSDITNFVNDGAASLSTNPLQFW